MNLENLCIEVNMLAKEAGSIMKKYLNQLNYDNIEVKGKHNYVTFVDKEIEKFLVESLLKILPEAGFIVEEGTSSNLGETYNWVIDPLDGTTNFIHGLPPFCVSIALMSHDEVILGVIYEPNLDELFFSWDKAPAYLNGKEIIVSKTSEIDNSLIATGFPYTDYERMESYMKLFDYCLHNTRGLRRLGSAAIDLAYVACGRFDGFYEYGLSPWDVAAGAFLVKQAGGKVTDFCGGKNFIFGKEIIAFNGKIYDEFQSITSNYFECN